VAGARDVVQHNLRSLQIKYLYWTPFILHFMVYLAEKNVMVCKNNKAFGPFYQTDFRSEFNDFEF